MLRNALALIGAGTIAYIAYKNIDKVPFLNGDKESDSTGALPAIDAPVPAGTTTTQGQATQAI